MVNLSELRALTMSLGTTTFYACNQHQTRDHTASKDSKACTFVLSEKKTYHTLTENTDVNIMCVMKVKR